MVIKRNDSIYRVQEREFRDHLIAFGLILLVSSANRSLDGFIRKLKARNAQSTAAGTALAAQRQQIIDYLK
jgi:hypothetical protein